MPRGQRLLTKRDLNQARKHTSWIHYYLEQLEKIYRPVHPEIADVMKTIDETNALVDTLIEQLDEQI